MTSTHTTRTKSSMTTLLGLSIESLTSPSLMHKFVITNLFEDPPEGRYYDYLHIKFEMGKVAASEYIYRLTKYSIMYKKFITDDGKLALCSIQLWKPADRAKIYKKLTKITPTRYTLAKIIETYNLVTKLNSYIAHNSKVGRTGGLKRLKLRTGESLAAHSV